MNMNIRECILAILNYDKYDKFPMIHFGFWNETLEKWCNEGHLTADEAKGWKDGNDIESVIASKLGFDFNWFSCFHPDIELFPDFKTKVVEGHLESDYQPLKDRASWEEHYLPRLRYSNERIDFKALEAFEKKQSERKHPLGIFCGSLFGSIRCWTGVEGISYLYADDEDLYDEIINTVGDLCFKVTEKVLSTGVKFDYGHFWEDICFKNGPLVKPSVFNEKVGPHYRRIARLLEQYDISIVSVDCDGWIDSLIPIWLENRVNTMFPIEVGTWGGNIEPWRNKYGKELRGVGGMDKRAFIYDYDAVDAEIERLKPLVEMGGYIPCPDHRIAPDAKWENVQYYCDRMRKVFD